MAGRAVPRAPSGRCPGITGDQLARGGYTVHTTFDLTAQDATTAQLPDAAWPLVRHITKSTWSKIYGAFPGPAGNRRHIQLYRTAE